MNAKLARRLEDITQLANDNDGLQEVANALADCERALKRAVKRAETLSGEYERVEMVQTRGPTIEFTGRLLAEDAWETRGRNPMRMAIEIWQTQGGALIASSFSEPADREGFEDTRVAVIAAQDDAQAMHFAVLDHFNWDNRARGLAKNMGWALRTEVE